MDDGKHYARLILKLWGNFRDLFIVLHFHGQETQTIPSPETKLKIGPTGRVKSTGWNSPEPGITPCNSSTCWVVRTSSVWNNKQLESLATADDCYIFWTQNLKAMIYIYQKKKNPTEDKNSSSFVLASYAQPPNAGDKLPPWIPSSACGLHACPTVLHTHALFFFSWGQVWALKYLQSAGLKDVFWSLMINLACAELEFWQSSVYSVN